MKFEEALKALRDGEKVKRKDWDDRTRLQLFQSVDFTQSMIQRIRRSSDFSPWHPKQEDILAEDYEIFDEEEEETEEEEE